MKAIILAAGEGKRMRPLTLTRPKPMVSILGKPLLHHIIDSLPAEITELVIVVGYKAEAIQKYFGANFEGKKIHYAHQERALGNAHALFLCKPYIKKGEKFLAMFADDLHSPAAIAKLIKRDWGLLVAEHPEPRKFGVVNPARARFTAPAGAAPEPTSRAGPTRCSSVPRTPSE